MSILSELNIQLTVDGCSITALFLDKSVGNKSE